MSENGSRPGYERCGARKRSDGLPCGLPAGHGTDHVGTGRCRRHGGNTPTHVASGREAQARQAAARFGVPVPTRATDALLEEIARTMGIVYWLMPEVEKLAEAGDLTWGTTKRTIKTNPGQGAQQGVPQVEVTLAAGLHPLVAYLERERKHLAQVCEASLRAGVEERAIRVIESQVIQLARTIRAVLGDISAVLCEDCRHEVNALVPTSVPRRIRELAA
jgi:hypothetical protein